MASEPEDERSVDDVTRRAEERAITLEAVAERPCDFDLSSAAMRDFCERNAAALSARLTEGLTERPPLERLAVARLLELARDPVAGDILLDLAEAGADAVREEALFALSMLRPELMAALDAARAFERLNPLFVTSTGREPRRCLAVILVNLDLPEARALARRLLKSEDLELRMIAARRLVKDGDVAAWPALKSLIGSLDAAASDQRYHAQGLAEDLAEAAPALRADIAQTAAEAVDARLGASDNETANEIWRLLDVVAATTSEREPELLERVVRSSAAGWARGVAFERLAAREGAAFAPRLEAALGDPALRAHALEALTTLGSEAATPSILERVRTLVAEEGDETLLGTAVDALRALAGGDDPALAAALGRLDPWRRFALRCRLDGVDFDALVGALARAELVAPGAEAALTEEARETGAAAWAEGDGFDAVLGLLFDLDALHAFDAKHFLVPPEYDDLLDGLARVAAPRVVLSAWSLSPAARRTTDDEGKERLSHEIRLLVDGAPARVEVADYGRWRDVAGLLGGLNAALAAAGRAERFATLRSEDQGVYVVVATEAGVDALRAELDFPFSEDPDASMRAGVSYARRVIGALDKE